MLGGSWTAYAARPRDDSPDVEIRAEDGSVITMHGARKRCGTAGHWCLRSPTLGSARRAGTDLVTYLDQYRIIGGQTSELWHGPRGPRAGATAWHSSHVFAEPGIAPECRTSTRCLQHRLGEPVPARIRFMCSKPGRPTLRLTFPFHMVALPSHNSAWGSEPANIPIERRSGGLTGRAP
jgi:hypothetical protein